MTDPVFVCTACSKDVHQCGTEDVMTECRVCHRVHCKDCVDEFGRCVDCQTAEPLEEK
jgi:hypothetical protein